MKLSHSEVADICRRLALLLHAGIGLADGVFLLVEEESGTLQKLLQDMGTQMDGGETLSTAMKKAGVFPGSVTGLVSIGEQTGRVEEVLEAIEEDLGPISYRWEYSADGITWQSVQENAENSLTASQIDPAYAYRFVVLDQEGNLLAQTIYYQTQED